jgi:hypothetical protein
MELGEFEMCDIDENEESGANAVPHVNVRITNEE